MKTKIESTILLTIIPKKIKCLAMHLTKPVQAMCAENIQSVDKRNQRRFKQMEIWCSGIRRY